MPYTLNLEEHDGRWIAHVAELPGAFASAVSQAEALAAAADAIAAYRVWNALSPEEEAAARAAPPPETQVGEIIRAWDYAPDHAVNAFFATDRPALTEADAADARRWLYLSRAELLDAFLGVADEDLNRELPGEDWSVNGVLRHLATGENWLLDRFGLAQEAAWDMPDTLGRLFLVRQQLLDVLPHLAADERLEAVNGELWTPRKIVRRAVWHERDHAAHLRRLRARLRAEPRHA